MPPALLASRTLPRVRPCLRSLARPAARCLHASAAACASSGAPVAAMDADVRAVVAATHTTPTQAVVFLSGGGSQVRTPQ